MIEAYSNEMRSKHGILCLVFSLLLFSVVFLRSIPSEGQLQWTTHTRIEVFADGSATWLVRQQTALVTEDDVAAFWQYLNITSLDDISNYIRSIVDHASLVTGRPMRVENGSIVVNANVSLLTSEGIFQYQFEWIGFAEIVGEAKMRIGDALSGELDLAREDMLTIKHPIGYSSIIAYPAPDEMRASESTLTWFGPRNFGAGEPNAVFEKVNFTWADVIMANAALLAVVAAAIASGFLGFFLGLKRPFSSQSSKVRTEPARMPLAVEKIEDDKEKVTRLLVNAGGRMHQSAIARQCGFSKAKASELLSVMEQEGIIARKKMGRGKVVTLIKSEPT